METLDFHNSAENYPILISKKNVGIFREMRRKKQELSQEACAAILNKGTSGVLAVLGDGGYPYTVPLSYVYYNGKIYFHCAQSGHKLDAIQLNPKASFCVIGQDHIIPQEYTTYFRSVIAFGTVRILENEAEKRQAIQALAIQYSPKDSAEHRDAEIEREWKRLCLLEFTVDHLSGKEAIELIQAK